MHQSSERYKAVALLAKFSTIFVDGGGAAIEGEASIQTANHVDEETKCAMGQHSDCIQLSHSQLFHAAQDNNHSLKQAANRRAGSTLAQNSASLA